MDILILLLKYIVTILFVFGVIVFPFKDKEAIRVLVSPKIIHIYNASRLFNIWNLFNKNGTTYNTIIILAKTNKKLYEWDLRFNKKICDIIIDSTISRVTLAHYYGVNGKYYFNEYFFEKIKKYLENKGEELVYFRIKEYHFNIFTKTIANKKIQDEEPTYFEWIKENNDKPS